MASWLCMMSRTAVRASCLRNRSNSRTPTESFENVRMWLKEIERYAADYVEKLLIGNKSDLIAKKVVEYSIAKVSLSLLCYRFRVDQVLARIQEFADSLNIPFLETSAKDSTNVDEMFYTMTKLIRQRYVTLASPHGSRLTRLQRRETRDTRWGQGWGTSRCHSESGISRGGELWLLLSARWTLELLYRVACLPNLNLYLMLSPRELLLSLSSNRIAGHCFGGSTFSRGPAISFQGRSPAHIRHRMHSSETASPCNGPCRLSDSQMSPGGSKQCL